MSEEVRLSVLIKLGKELAEKRFPRYFHSRGNHRYTVPQLACCLLLKIYLRLPYRRLEVVLKDLLVERKILGLEEVPDHTTLCRAMEAIGEEKILEMIKEISRLAEEKEDMVAHDGTGLKEERGSEWYYDRKGKRRRKWLMVIYSVGVKSQLTLHVVIKRGPGGEGSYLKELKDGVRGLIGEDVIHIADRGFDGEWVEEGDIIPPIRRGGSLKGEERKRREELYQQARIDGIYGQRWKVEAVISVEKRVLGEKIYSVKESNKRKEVLLRVLVMNLRRYLQIIFIIYQRAEEGQFFFLCLTSPRICNKANS